MLRGILHRASDWSADRLGEWVAGLAITLAIKYNQPKLFQILVNWTDDDPLGD